MRIGILQSNYIPWRGYFDFINSVDLFIFHDDIQYTKQDWRNRNKIKTDKGLEWLTVPVKKAPTETPIDRIEIAGEEWRTDHRRKLGQHLGKAPHFKDAIQLWEKATRNQTFLSDMNIALITDICFYLGIHTSWVRSRHLGITGVKTERIAQMMRKFGGTTYVSGPAAKCYLDVQGLADMGVEVEWKDYNYLPYPQQYGDFQFENTVTVLDLIANLGPEAKNHIRSYTTEEMQAMPGFAHYNQ